MIKKILLSTIFLLLAGIEYAYAAPVVTAIWAIGVIIVDWIWLHPVIAALTAVSIGFSIASMTNIDKLKGSKYTTQAISNSNSNEGIVPLIYGGPILIGGNIIWQSEPGETVERFLSFCVGEVQSVTDIIVDEQPIAELSGCSYTAYLGTSTQTVDARGSATVKGLRDVCHIAVTITKSDKVSSNPIVGARIKGRKISIWDSGISAWSSAKSFSKNPAAIIRDYMTLSTVVGGCGISSAFIDAESFGDFFDHCAVHIDNGSGGTEPRYELDLVTDTKHSALDNLAKMLITCNAQLIRSASTYKLVFEKANESAVMAFTEDNINKGTFKYGYGKTDEIPNKVNVEWISPLVVKNPKRLAWAEDELDQEIRGMREVKIEMYGIIRQSQASRQAKKLLYESKLNDIWCEFEGNIEAMHCEPYDVVSVTHSRPNWTAAAFRIVQINEVNFGNARYALQAYNSSIIDDGYGSTFDDWDYGSPPNPYEAVTDVTNLALAEIGWVNTDGTWVINIDVTWTPPATKIELLRNYIIELKKGSDNYKPIGVAAASATTYRVSVNLEPEETYYVRIKTSSIHDIISDGRVSSAITLEGNTALPDDVPNFSYSWGKNIELTWGTVSNIDLQGYEIRDEDANFGTDNANLIFRGLVNKKVLIPVTRSPGTFYIRAINSSNNYSANSVSVTPINAAPAIPLSFRGDILFNLARLYWTDDTATDIIYYEVYVSKTNAWSGEEILFGKIPGRLITATGESSQNGISDDDGIANTNYITDLDLAGWGPDYWKGSYIEIISGTGNGQEVKILSYATATGKFTMVSNWGTKPDTTSKFFLHPVRYYKVRGVDGFGPGNFTSALEIKFVEFSESMLGDEVITARKVYTGEVITLSAQIKNAIIENAHIVSLNAQKIIAGTITADKYEELRNTYVYNAIDSLDASYSLAVPFKIVSELLSVQSVKLSFQILNFRAYAKTVASGGAATSGATGSPSGGGDTSGSAGNSHSHTFAVATTGDTTSSKNIVYQGGTLYRQAGGTLTWTSTTVEGHNHTISITGGGWPAPPYKLSYFYDGKVYVVDSGIITTSTSDGHDHQLICPEKGAEGGLLRDISGTVSAFNQSGNAIASIATSEHVHSTPDHTHPNHQHSTPDHEHPLGYGIFEDNTAPTIHYHIDNGAGYGAASAGFGADQTDIDITADISGAGWKSIRFDTDLRCRIAAIIEVKLDISA